MSPKELRHFARQTPFVPFRLFVSNGSSYDVRHPELCMVGKSSLVVGITLHPEETEYDHVATIDMDHITHVERLPATAPTGGNGKQ